MPIGSVGHDRSGAKPRPDGNSSPRDCPVRRLKKLRSRFSDPLAFGEQAIISTDRKADGVLPDCHANLDRCHIKNSTPTNSTVGTTKARSKKSLCCSHDVSEISRQPWQALPKRG